MLRKSSYAEANCNNSCNITEFQIHKSQSRIFDDI